MGRLNDIKRRRFIQQCALGIGGTSILSTSKIFGASFISNSNLFTVSESTIDTYTREATYYIQTPRGPKCQLCPNECTVKEGELGDCRSRTTIAGKLYTLAYGNPCAIHVDPIEKKPLYHFLPASNSFSIATAGCNLACLNCQNWAISQSSPKETRNIDLMPDKVVEQTVLENCKSISYTYSEPITFYEYVYDTSKLAHQKNIKNVLVSNGYINEIPLQNLCNVIDAANIDLKSFSNEIYLKLNSGTLQPVLDTLKIMKSKGVWLEITNLIVPGWTDNIEMIKQMCDWLVSNGFTDTPMHFSRFQPLYKLTQLNETPLSVLNKARQIAISSGLHFVYIDNVPGSDACNTVCPNCKKVVVERMGYKILQNNIKQGKCTYCNTGIPGIWP